jgi:2-keto-4-pentenoate hydratase
MDRGASGAEHFLDTIGAMLGPTEVSRFADVLARAEQQASAVPPLTDTFPDLTSEDAYRIQLENVTRRRAAGQRVVGAKVGLTAKVMQEQLGVDQPDYGHIFDTMVHRSGAVLRAADYCAPRVEVEIAFVLRRGLRGPDCTVEDVLAATERVVPAIEVIDSRIDRWRIRLPDTIADNASSAAVVLGDRGTSPGDVDLTSVGVRLRRGGEMAAEGRADAVLGDPARAVAWVADRWSARGDVLRSGWLVMPGSCTAAVAAEPGADFVAELDGIGQVTVSFS